MITGQNVLKAEHGDCGRFSASPIQGRCAHCSARYFRVSASAIADLCGWQKRQRGSSSSSGGDSEFAACNKLEEAFGARAKCTPSCSLLAGEHTGNRRSMRMAEAVARQQQRRRRRRLGVRRVWQVGIKIRFTGAVLTALLAVALLSGIGGVSRSRGAQGFNSLPTRRGSRPCWGPSASSSAHAGGPIQGACRAGLGKSSRGNSVVEPKRPHRLGRQVGGQLPRS